MSASAQNLAWRSSPSEFARDRAFRRAQLRAHGARDLADELAAPDFTFEQVQRRGFARLPDHWVADGERLELRERVLGPTSRPATAAGI